MIELLLLFVAIILFGLVALVWLGASLLYLIGKLVIGGLWLFLQVLVGLGKGVLLLVGLGVSLLAYVFSGIASVLGVIALGALCVWGVAALLRPRQKRLLVETTYVAPARPRTSAEQRLDRLMLRFEAAERRMRDMEQRLAWRG